jgi:uncharacterized repeat protein (TIGR01451 family)
VSESDGVDSLVPGSGSVTYTIIVKVNAGPSTVTAFTLTDTNGTGFTPNATAWTLMAAQPGSIQSQTGTTVTWNGAINNGDTVKFLYKGKIDPSATGTTTNKVHVDIGGGATDTNTANNDAMDTDTLTPQFDLMVTKTDSKTTINKGANDTYTITVTNNGPSTATGGFTLTEAADAVFTANASPWGGGTVNGSSSGSFAMSTTPVIVFTGSIVPGAANKITITYAGKVSSTAVSGSTVTNTVTVTAAGDSDNTNNSGTDTTTVN